MSYCIAFSIDGATDVTRRYVRNASRNGAERNKCPEEVLMYITNEIRRMRRQDMAKEERRTLIIEDDREEKELRGYVINSLATELGRMLPGGCEPGTTGGNGGPPGSGGDQKLPARRSGAQAWREARGENGGNDQPPDDGRPPRDGH